MSVLSSLTIIVTLVTMTPPGDGAVSYGDAAVPRAGDAAGCEPRQPHAVYIVWEFVLFPMHSVQLLLIYPSRVLFLLRSLLDERPVKCSCEVFLCRFSILRSHSKGTWRSYDPKSGEQARNSLARATRSRRCYLHVCISFGLGVFFRDRPVGRCLCCEALSNKRLVKCLLL